jgi:hypothetical protein
VALAAVATPNNPAVIMNNARIAVRVYFSIKPSNSSITNNPTEECSGIEYGTLVSPLRDGLLRGSGLLARSVDPGSLRRSRA